MLPEIDRKVPEYESFIGFTTLDVAKAIVDLDPRIRQIQLLPYLHRRGDTFTEPPIPLTREEFLTDEGVQLVAAKLKEGWDMALSSRVTDAEDKIWHLPTMDLHPEETPKNTAKIAMILREFIVPDFGNGFLLASGTSYQFLGDKLLTPDEWIGFLNTFAPLGIASQKYPGHCLKQSHGCLRFTANGEKKVIPRVIAVI